MDAAPRLALAGLLPPDLALCLVRPELARVHRPSAATGIASLDALLGGGFPRGRIAEVVGPRSSGRTSVLLGVLAGATARGAVTALVDATDGFDPASAQTLGVDLDRLLWVRCGGALRKAVQAADVVVRGGGFDVVVVDWGELPPWALARVPAAAVVRLQRAVEATPTAFVLSGARRVAGSLAAVAVALAAGRAGWAVGGPGLLARLEAEARLVRSRERAPGTAARVLWRFLS